TLHFPDSCSDAAYHAACGGSRRLPKASREEAEEAGPRLSRVPRRKAYPRRSVEPYSLFGRRALPPAERVSATGRYGILDRVTASVCFDVRRPDHLGPLLGFVGNEPPEITWRATEDNAAEVGQLSLQLGIGEAGVDLLAELADDLGRYVCRWAEAEPAARPVARHKLSHTRKVRQCARARDCAHRQRAQHVLD